MPLVPLGGVIPVAVTAVVESSSGVATPVGAVVGEVLQVTPVGSVKFGLIAYSRWPWRVGLPMMVTGVGATGMASLKAWGLELNTSATLPLRSAAHSPADGAIRLTGCAAADSVE